MAAPPELVTSIALRTLRVWCLLVLPVVLGIYSARITGVNSSRVAVVLAFSILASLLILAAMNPMLWFLLLGL